MSNALAIATVTAGLAAVITSSVEHAVPGSGTVMGRPQTAPPGKGVQLFLYQVVPNAALRNADLSTRKADGTLTQKPQIALDLHYLLAFFGDEKELEPQRMLGAVARDLHAHPFLTPSILESAVVGWQPLLDGSNIAQQVERVKLTPLALSLEELSKLWSVFFQTPYALSVAYHASVVLIDTDDAVKPLLPVLRRGKNDDGVEALLGSLPVLEKIQISFSGDTGASALPSLPVAWLGLVLTIQGQYLAGDRVTLTFSHPLQEAFPALKMQPVEIAANDRTATSITFILPTDVQAQSDWAAGAYTITAEITQGKKIRTTNAINLNLAARITKIDPANPVPIVGGNAILTLTVSPQLLPKQTISLLIDDREIPAQPFAAASNEMDFVIDAVQPLKEQIVYLRVDGVDSLPITRASDPPRFVFADEQKVTIQ
jgi:hypothetical protein